MFLSLFLFVHLILFNIFLGHSEVIGEFLYIFWGWPNLFQDNIPFYANAFCNSTAFLGFQIDVKQAIVVLPT